MYSVYAPKMISESAIGMSKGGRVSSASAAIMKMAAPSGCVSTYQYRCCASAMPTSDSVPACITTATAASTIGSSYAISWAAARRAPISENLFALAHPAIRMPITLTEVMART